MINKSADEWLALGLQLQAEGRTTEALAAFQRAVETHPHHAEAIYHLGAAFHSQNLLTRARDCYARALVIAPDHLDAHYALGIASLQLKDPTTACRELAVVVAQQPDHQAAWGYLGQACEARKRYHEAIHAFETAATLQPEVADNWINLGRCQTFAGQFPMAADSWTRAIRLDPDAKPAYSGLMHVLYELRQHDLAEEVVRQALQRWPQDMAFRHELLRILNRQFRCEEVIAWLDENPDLLRSPGLQVMRALQLPLVPMSRQEIEAYRRRLTQELERLTAEGITLEQPILQPGRTNFAAAYHGCDDRPLQEELASFYLKACPRLGWTAPHCALGAARQVRPDERIKIGFASRHFQPGHAVMLSYGETLRHFDPSQFHITLFLLGNNGSGETARVTGADRVVPLPSRRLEELQSQIAAEQLDVLVYLDIGMEPISYFLSFARLAPVQGVLDGHPDTTGVPNVDYFITAQDMEPDDADEHYSEQSIRLKTVGSYYERPKLPQREAVLPTLGIEPSRVVYFVAQNLFKLHPDFDDLLAAILQRDPEGDLLLVAGKSKYETDRWLQRFSSRFGDLANRIHFVPFLPFDKYANLLLDVDCVLDPLWFGGGTTLINCFAFGVPVVTLPGPFLRNRMAYGFYKRMGILDLVASDFDHYVTLACRLAHDKAWQQAMKQAILEARGCLYHDVASVKEVEAFYRSAHEAAQRGQRITQWPPVTP